MVAPCMRHITVYGLALAMLKKAPHTISVTIKKYNIQNFKLKDERCPLMPQSIVRVINVDVSELVYEKVVKKSGAAKPSKPHEGQGFGEEMSAFEVKMRNGIAGLPGKPKHQGGCGGAKGGGVDKSLDLRLPPQLRRESASLTLLLRSLPPRPLARPQTQCW